MKKPTREPGTWLAHPLLLLLIGAAISNYLVPSLTRQWQTHQKGLETKTALTTQINKSVTEIILAVQFVEVGAASQTQEHYDRAYRDWEIERAILGSQLRAYFPQTEIWASWKSFSDIVTEVYALSGTDGSARIERLTKIGVYLSTSAVDWKVLERLENRESAFAERQQYQGAWSALRDALLARKDAIVQEILNYEGR